VPTESSGNPGTTGSQVRISGRAPRGNIFRKYLVLIVFLVSGGLVTSGLVEVYFGYKENVRATTSLQREKAAQAALRIEQFVKDVEGQLWWAKPPRAAVSSVSLDRLRVDFHRLLRHIPAITQLSLLDPKGQERLRISRLEMEVLDSGIDHSSQLTFTQAKIGGTYFSPVYFLKDSVPYMTVAMAGDDPDQGVTVAEVNLQFILDVISQLRVGKAGVAYVVDPEGTLVAHSDITLVLRKTSMGHLAQVRSALSGSQGEEGGVARDIQGRRVLSAHTSIPLLGWVVFVEQPLEEAFEPIYASIFRTVSLLLAGLLVSTVASFFLARTMVRPILALQKGVARIGAGELDHRVHVRTGDEIEMLATGLNAMTASLQEAHTGLERKVAERTEELRDTNRKLDDANRHKSQFLANVSHELRTPLNTIIGFTRLVLRKTEGQIAVLQTENLRKVVISAEHLLNLINQLLDLAKIEAGRMEVVVDSFALPELIDVTASSIEPMLKDGVILAKEVDPDLPPLSADRDKLKQIMINLMSNAAKFTAEGEVRISAHREDGRLKLVVSDTGIGISREAQEHVFEEFRQADMSTTRQYGGTGLGLAIVKQLVTLMRGSITVESEVGKGSRFIVTLPIDYRAPKE